MNACKQGKWITTKNWRKIGHKIIDTLDVETLLGSSPKGLGSYFFESNKYPEFIFWVG